MQPIHPKPQPIPRSGPCQLALAVATSLIATAAVADPVYLSAELQTQAMYNQTRFSPVVQLQDPEGPAPSGRLEGYLEHRNRFSNARDAMASAIAQDNGDLQAGAEVGPSTTGTSNVFSWLHLAYSNDTLQAQRITFKFDILPGEVLIKDMHNFGLPVLKDLFKGGISYALDVTNPLGDTFNVYDVGFSLFSIDRHWEIGNQTTSFGMQLIDQVFDGGDQFGVTLRGLTMVLARELEPGDHIGVDLILQAWASKNVLDWPGLMSARVGDPSKPSLRSAYTADVVPITATPEPEPASAWLTGLALPGLSVVRARPCGAMPTQ